MGEFAWALWLATPVVLTVFVALVIWWRGRPRRLPTTDEAVLAHAKYLDALTSRPRGTHRVPGYAARRD